MARSAIIVTLLAAFSLAVPLGAETANRVKTAALLAAGGPSLLPEAAEYIPAPGAYGLVEPVDGFVAHATKKHFGMYITPETSPIKGDRFKGFHTGVDAEFGDVSGEVPVRAIADGTVVLAKWVNGYGGLIVIRHSIAGTPIFALYGHLDEATFAPNLTTVTRGQTIAMLGDDHSHETDGVRKHLHFALYEGEKVDYRGYVPNQEDLEPWRDPLDFFAQ